MKPTWIHTIAHNPEWMAVFASSVFAFFTVVVIVWQVRVMIWQGKNSDRHERTQNRLLRLQFEREWMERKNAQREVCRSRCDIVTRESHWEYKLRGDATQLIACEAQKRTNREREILSVPIHNPKKGGI